MPPIEQKELKTHLATHIWLFAISRHVITAALETTFLFSITISLLAFFRTIPGEMSLFLANAASFVSRFIVIVISVAAKCEEICFNIILNTNIN